MERSTAGGTALLIAAVLAIAAFLPVWRCCPPEGRALTLGSHDAATLARRLKALLRGVPCDTCEGRGRVSLFHVLTK